MLGGEAAPSPRKVSLVSKPPASVTLFQIGLQRRMRTSNPLVRVNMEIKRRTRVASIFPNGASLLSLVSALLAETSDQ